MKRLAAILMAAVLPLMVVGIMASETDYPNPLNERTQSGCMFADYEHSPPEAVCCVIIAITTNDDAVSDPYFEMTNTASTIPPTTENTVIMITWTVLTGATERAGPAVATCCNNINLNSATDNHSPPAMYMIEFATATIQFVVYTENDRASPTNYAMWSGDGQANYAKYLNTITPNYTGISEMEAAAIPARRLVVYNVSGFMTNEASPAGETPNLTREVWCPNIGENLAFAAISDWAIPSQRPYPNPYA